MKQATAPIPPTLVAIGERVGRRIDALLSAEIDRWCSLDPEVRAPLASLQALVMAGGKRLRPAFCHWAYVGAGGDPDDAMVVDAGAALEMLHTFALVHDDVMDGSVRRRGLSTVHLDYEARHLTSDWRGEGRRFGEGVAILVGDLAFVYADLLLAGAPRTAIEVFTELRLEVNIGQYLDLVGTVQGSPTVASARRICQYKSGKYTVERPLHLGAALAGRLEDLAGPLTEYGMPLGEAFQLRDDLLGAFGDSEVTGKPVGEDIREGKPTALFAMALEAATGSEAELLAGRFGAVDLDDDEIAAIQTVLESTGAKSRTEAAVESLTAQAIAAIERAPLEGDARSRLAELARFVAGRDF